MSSWSRDTGGQPLLSPWEGDDSALNIPARITLRLAARGIDAAPGWLETIWSGPASPNLDPCEGASAPRAVTWGRDREACPANCPGSGVRPLPTPPRLRPIAPRPFGRALRPRRRRGLGECALLVLVGIILALGDLARRAVRR